MGPKSSNADSVNGVIAKALEIQNRFQKTISSMALSSDKYARRRVGTEQGKISKEITFALTKLIGKEIYGTNPVIFTP